MKNYLLSFFLILCSVLITFSQNNDYYNRMAHIFENIDKTKVYTGYLKEFGVRLTDVEVYDGSLNSDNIINTTQWQSLYSSLYSMRVGNTAASMAAPSAIFNTLKSHQKGNVDVSFAVQYFIYQQYKSNAVSNGDVTINNDHIFDVVGRDPYDLKTVFGVTPLNTKLQGDTFSFKLPSALIYTNSDLTLSQIQIDFDDGNGYQTISLDIVKHITYTSGGEKFLKIKFMYSNGPTLYSRSKIWLDYVWFQGTQARFNNSNVVRDTIIGDPYMGISGVGFISTKTAGTDGVFDKPLIVIEGLDPEDNFDYYNLINSDNPGSLNIYIDNSSNLTLNQAIENEGYDLVFVNFAKSTDYIQRNAYMIETVIEWVNTRKAVHGSSEKNVVLGMSMGGLIARYALRHMEIDNKLHDTKLYISHDTPHQGANVPLAYQAMLRHLVGEQISLPVFLSLFDVNVIDFADQVPELEEALSLLQTPAAQQMLVYQLQGTGANVSVNNNSLYNSFANEYKSLGYPVQGNIRNIAISNGAECGTPLDFGPYDLLVNIDEKIDLPYFLANVAFGIINGLSINPLKIISSALSTNTDLKARFILRALPNNQAKQIYSGKLFIEKTILFAITVEEPLMDQEIVSSTSSMLPLDNASGGFYDIDQFVTLPSILNNYVLERQFNFIPTYSSLDISAGNQHITISDLTKIYSPLAPPIVPMDTPFDNFFTNPSISQNHTKFTFENGNWLIDELSGTPGIYSCSSSCVGQLNIRIVGENQLCTSETYTLDNLAPNVSVSWSIDSPGAFNLVASGNSVTVNSLGLLNGEVTLRATLSTDCSNIIEDKTIYVGTRRPKLYDNVGNETTSIQACVNSYYGITFDTPPGTLEWEWNKGFGNFYLSSNENYGSIFASQPTSGIINVRIRDACG